MNVIQIALATTILTTGFIGSYGQMLNSDNASDPVAMQTRVSIDIESFIFHNNAQFYVLRPGYYYGLKNKRHLFGMSLPFMHNIFNGDYAGFENTTGFGDLKITYLFVPYVRRNSIETERITLSMEVTAPTGEYRLGRGVGAWQYKPGLIITVRPGPFLAFYPEVRFQFSGDKVNSQAGTDGIPDPDDPEKDTKMQNLSVSIPLVAQLSDWNGWFAVNVLYTRSLTERSNFFFMRTDFGKMLGPDTSAALRITKFIAGQPRLNVVVQANLSFYFR